MGTLQTLVTDVKYKVRDPNGNQYSDPEILAAVNGIIEEITLKLQNIESNLVYSHGTITLADGTKEYTPSFSHMGFLDDGVWIDDESVPLKFTHESNRQSLGYEDDTDEGEPVYFYFEEGGDVGFIPTSDDTYTVNVHYWKPMTTLTTIATDDLPFEGIWNTYIKQKLIMDLLDRQGKDISKKAILTTREETQAMNRTYQYGCRRRYQTSDMFDVDGV